MDSELSDADHQGAEGRPYRSHVQPACFPCRSRKSRCQTGQTVSSSACAMCQAHGTACVFPQAAERRSRGPRSSRPPRRSTPAGAMTPVSRPSRSRCPSSPPPTLTQRMLQSYSTPRSEPHRAARTNSGAGLDHHTGLADLASLAEHPSTSTAGHPDDSVTALMDIIAVSDEGSSHVVSPAIADDDRVFQEYLCNTPSGQSRRMVRFHLNLNNNQSGHRPPILFSFVPKRGQRETESRSLAASNCEIIEKLIEPHQNDLIDLFFEKINMVLPIFDEPLFRRVFATHKERISPGLLSNLYGMTLTFWNTSPRLSSVVRPDHRSVLIQAENSFNAELISTPGISTIISLLLNISGRPSSHHLGNGGMLGMAISLANAFGLNRDPSDWNLSPSEKKFRIRIWWILVIYDRWCSLAYGIPPLIRRTQHDVPVLTVEDITNPSIARDQTFASSCFVALTTLTEVLSHCLEHVYHLGKDISKPDASPFDLENLLTNWEDSLSDGLRRLVIRGTNLVGPGAANLRLAYLSVKLLIRRVQLDWDKMSLRVDDVDSQHYIQARRVAEEIVDFVRELDETHCSDFWIPPNAYSLTSATTFLLRSALNTRGLAARNSPLKLARAMIDALRFYRRAYGWDIADNCLSNCGDLVDKIEAACDQHDQSSPNTLELENPMPVDMDMDFAALNGLFPGFTGSL